nr:hypothetical protein [Wolbachia endosymbiont of Psylliodes chrysocephala]
MSKLSTDGISATTATAVRYPIPFIVLEHVLKRNEEKNMIV